MKSKVVGLILAAGYSSRMDSFKPLLPIGNRTAGEVLMDAFVKAGVPETFIVTGFNRDHLKGLIDAKGASEIYNAHFEQGMFSSIQAGIKELDSAGTDEINGALLGLVDCPLVSEDTIRLILEKADSLAKQGEDSLDEPFIIPCYQGKKGHPIYIPRKYFQEIISYNGPLGLKGFMNQYRNIMEYVETKDEAVVLDMDDKSGYEEILNYYKKEKTESIKAERNADLLKTLLGKKRLFLIRHCEQKQIGEKIFLGQVDLPLSEEGVASAKKIGENLLTYKISTNKMYTSDLKRAKETARLIWESLSRSNPETDRSIIENKGFREINLGSWDGKPIREIKEKFPEEYRERGRNLLGYKADPLSENFYDLQYRVLKELKKILMETVEEDIIIVTHAGVINVMLSNFNNTSLEEQLKFKLERGSIYLVQNREDL